MSERDLDCEDVLRRLLEYLDRELDSGEAGSIARHLERCRACFSRAEFEKKLKDSLRATGLRRASLRLRLRLKSIIEGF